MSPTLTIDDKARSQLGELRKQSLAATSIDGRWVLQLDSKWEGVSDPRQTASDGTHVFRAHDILSRYMSLKQAMAAINVPVFLVAATDYGHNTINNHGVIWTTIADPMDIYSQAQGHAECVALFPRLTGLALDDACTPRRLTPPH